MVEVYRREDLDSVVRALTAEGYAAGEGAEFTHHTLSSVTLVGCGDNCFVAYGVERPTVPSKALTKKAHLQMTGIDINKVDNMLRQRSGVQQLADSWYTLEGGMIWCNLSHETNTVYPTSYAVGDTVKHMLSVAIMLRGCYK